jgi:hypothetical protein
MSAPLLAPLVETLARFLRTRDSGAGELSVLVTGGLPAEDPRVLFTLAPRLVGKGPAPFAPDDLARVPWPVATLAIDELVRVVVLARAGEILNFDAYHALVEACYRQGEVREKVAVLRALPFLEGGASFVDIAQDACRSHVQPVFDAIACENPYPAQHFDAATFHQLVLKAIFTEVPIARIVGLAGHHDSELARMASAYIDERRAAGRSVPEDALFLVNKGTP